jgi:hypothetical protein
MLAGAVRWFFFDERECALIHAVLGELGRVPDSRARLLAELDELHKLAERVRESPSIRADGNGALSRALLAGSEFGVDLQTPPRVAIGAAYLVTKIAFLRDVLATLETVAAPSALVRCAANEVGESIYSKLAEELLISIATDAVGHERARQRAVELLLDLWEERLAVEVDDFAPLLQAAWCAREELQPIFGSLLGTHELMTLIRRASDRRFLDYFGEDHLEPEEAAAFEEFLFNLTHEELAALRSQMRTEGRSCLDAGEIRTRLGPRAAVEGLLPDRIYVSWRSRHLRAQARTLLAAPGPKKTAEEYVMTAVLRR